MWGKSTFIPCWWTCKLVQPHWKSVWRFLKKLKLEPPYDPGIPLLGMQSKNLKSAYYSDRATSMFITAEFTTAKLCQPRCPSTDKWFKKIWYIHMMEYYSAIKKNDIMDFADKWMELETIMLSEINQSPKSQRLNVLSDMCKLI